MSWRRVVSLVVLVGALLVGAHLFSSAQRGPVPVEIHYLLGDPPRATRLEVLFLSGAPEAGGEAIATFETSLVAPDVKQITRLPGGRHVMDITMSRADGTRRSVRRTIEAVRDAVIRIELSRDLP